MAVYRIKVSNYTGSSTMNVNVEVGECVVVKSLEKLSKINKKNRLQHQRIAKRVIEHEGVYSGRAIIYELEKVLSKNTSIGLDQWGTFYHLTKLESKGCCFWCGVKTRGRYCSSSHRLQYLRHYNWPMARDWCWSRYVSHCGLCGITAVERNKEWRYRSLEVHHITPIDGLFREWTVLNRPENLILLCPPCHDSTRRKNFAGITKEKVNPDQLILL